MLYYLIKLYYTTLGVLSFLLLLKFEYVFDHTDNFSSTMNQTALRLFYTESKESLPFDQHEKIDDQNRIADAMIFLYLKETKMYSKQFSMYQILHKKLLAAEEMRRHGYEMS